MLEASPPPWLDWTIDASSRLPVAVLLGRLALAWAAGCWVAWLARRRATLASIGGLTPPGGKAGDSLTLTLILMSVLIAMATQIIGDNIARAFSLVGALSIVRFRTAVAATRDVAFVLAAVVVGMAVGAGQYWVAGVGMIVVTFATFAQRDPTSATDTADPTPTEATWTVRLQTALSGGGGADAELRRYAESVRPVSVETIRRGASIESVYAVRPPADANAGELIAMLNRLPDVEAASAKIE